MKILYYVLKHGVSPQGIYGIFDNEPDATNAAIEAKEQEPDDYHDFYINSRELNKCGYEDISTTEYLGD